MSIIRKVCAGVAVAGAVVLALRVVPAGAFEPDAAPTAWGRDQGPNAAVAFQFKIPFGSGTADTMERPHFAFGMSTTASLFGSASFAGNDTAYKMPPLLNLTTFGDLHFRSMKVGGINVVQKEVRLDADGGTTTGNEVNWKLVGAGLIAGTMAILAITNTHGGIPTCDTGFASTRSVPTDPYGLRYSACTSP